MTPQDYSGAPLTGLWLPCSLIESSFGEKS